jgi:hypothetical protein
MLDPIQTHGMSSPAVVGSRDTPVGREVALGIEVVQALIIQTTHPSIQVSRNGA